MPIAPRYPFASWRLRSAHAADGGPIERLTVRQLECGSEKQWEAYAWLSPTLAHNRHYIGYGNCAGTGTHRRRTEAINIAVTEAIERWAFFATISNPETKNHHGFNIDCSTSGMAAAPSLLRSAPRRAAFFEACERWTIPAWWNGLLVHHIIQRTENSTSLVIETPFGMGACVVVVDSTSGHQTYGFAFDKTVSSAQLRAKSELRRNEIVVPRLAEHPISSIADQSERRLRFFAKEEGKEMFESRIRRNRKISRVTQPRLIVDEPIPGPWSRWCHVWRCLFEPSFADPGGDDFFLF
jgi:hypothetical protein